MFVGNSFSFFFYDQYIEIVGISVTVYIVLTLRSFKIFELFEFLYCCVLALKDKFFVVKLHKTLCAPRIVFWYFIAHEMSCRHRGEADISTSSAIKYLSTILGA